MPPSLLVGHTKGAEMRVRPTIQELDRHLTELAEGASIAIDQETVEELFGFNDAAQGRLANFAKGHGCRLVDDPFGNTIIVSDRHDRAQNVCGDRGTDKEADPR